MSQVSFNPPESRETGKRFPTLQELAAQKIAKDDALFEDLMVEKTFFDEEIGLLRMPDFLRDDILDQAIECFLHLGTAARKMARERLAERHLDEIKDLDEDERYLKHEEFLQRYPWFWIPLESLLGLPSLDTEDPTFCRWLYRIPGNSDITALLTDSRILTWPGLGSYVCCYSYDLQRVVSFLLQLSTKTREFEQLLMILELKSGWEAILDCITEEQFIDVFCSYSFTPDFLSQRLKRRGWNDAANALSERQLLCSCCSNALSKK